MKKTIKITVVIILFFSCNDDKKEILNKISGRDYKYWDVVNSQNSNQRATCYFFASNGKFRIFNYKDGKRVLYDGGDVVVPDTWNYLPDSTIMIATGNYKIEKLTADTFIYSHPKFGWNVLVKSINQSILLDTIIARHAVNLMSDSTHIAKE